MTTFPVALFPRQRNSDPGIEYLARPETKKKHDSSDTVTSSNNKTKRIFTSLKRILLRLAPVARFPFPWHRLHVPPLLARLVNSGMLLLQVQL